MAITPAVIAVPTSLHRFDQEGAHLPGIPAQLCYATNDPSVVWVCSADQPVARLPLLRSDLNEGFRYNLDTVAVIIWTEHHCDPDYIILDLVVGERRRWYGLPRADIARFLCQAYALVPPEHQFADPDSLLNRCLSASATEFAPLWRALRGLLAYKHDPGHSDVGRTPIYTANTVDPPFVYDQYEPFKRSLPESDESSPTTA